MKNVITSQAAMAYSQCPLKAYLLLCTDDRGEPHEYVRILQEQASISRVAYLTPLKQSPVGVSSYNSDGMKKGAVHLLDATLKADDLEAHCDVLTKAQAASSLGKYSYEPTIVVGTSSITKEQRLELSFAGYVLGQVQNRLPTSGTIVGVDGQVHKVNLADYRALRPIIATLSEWTAASACEPPPVILNPHCPSCQFRDQCRKKAESADDLSLLDRMTPKLLHQYHEKGIFTVNQLSYLFRPRRKRKRAKTTPTRFSLELQALAIRTKKVYIQL